MEFNDMKDTRGFQIHVYSTGNQFAQSITNNYNNPVYYGQQEQKKSGYTDEQIDRALTAINGDKKVLNNKQKWSGAYWYLRWVCNYPIISSAFCDKVNSLPHHNEWEYECNNNNIRALTTLSFMGYDPREMDKVKYSVNDEGAFLQCRQVALALEEELMKFVV